MTEEVSFKIKCARIAANVLNLLGEKNTQYGDSAFDPIRVFSKLGPDAGLRVRIDDKLSRLLRGNADMESDTDVIDDLIGYFILLRLSMDEQAAAEEAPVVTVKNKFGLSPAAQEEMEYFKQKDFRQGGFIDKRFGGGDSEIQSE
jgi:hypothetical protein